MRRDRDADAAGRVGDSAAGQARVGDAEALAFLADHVLMRHAHVGEGKLRRIVRAQGVDEATDLEAGCVRRDAKGAEALAAFGIAGADVQGALFGGVGAGDEDLGAVDHPVVAVADGPGAHCAGWVGAACRFGEADEPAAAAALASPPPPKRP